MKFRGLPTELAYWQISLSFDSDRLDLEGLEAPERRKVAWAVAEILMQATGTRAEELVDDKL
jgi:hypothetical protein